jgi:PKD repeat protein
VQVNTVVSFTAQAYGGRPDYTYNWNFGDSFSNSTNPNQPSGPNVTHSFSKASTYRVTVTIHDYKDTHPSVTVAKMIQITPPCPIPSITATPSGIIRPGTNVTFAGTATSGHKPYTYLWDINENIFVKGPNMSHVFADPGNYTVTLIVTDTYSVKGNATQTVVVQAPLPPPCQTNCGTSGGNNNGGNGGNNGTGNNNGSQPTKGASKQNTPSMSGLIPYIALAVATVAIATGGVFAITRRRRT